MRRPRMVRERLVAVGVLVAIVAGGSALVELAPPATGAPAPGTPTTAGPATGPLPVTHPLPQRP